MMATIPNPVATVSIGISIIMPLLCYCGGYPTKKNPIVNQRRRPRNWVGWMGYPVTGGGN